MRRPNRDSNIRRASVSATGIRDVATGAGMTLDTAQLAAADALERAGSTGVYLWGPVGRGKSWLMDTYLDLLPTTRKTRVHCHEFFIDLHTELHRRGHRLDDALDHLLGELEVVCFDEFQVDDPADGIFVRRLLDALLSRSIRLVLTSNQPPRGLMPNPLFHSTFEPTIALIETSLTVVAVNGAVDYRTITTGHGNTGFAGGRWIFPADVVHLDSAGLSWPDPSDANVLTPRGHSIRALSARDGQVWFDFEDLCAQPTSPADYAMTSDEFAWWVISGVPNPAGMGREPTKRFVHLIDVLYDRGIRVDLIADVSHHVFLDQATTYPSLARAASRLNQLVVG